MTNMITKKQAMYILLICMVGTKFQRLPSFLADLSGRSFWIVLLIYLLIDGFFLVLTLKIMDLAKGATLYEMIEKTFGKIVAKIVLMVFGVYFFMLAILPYESVHEVFSDIIFDSLPWKYFALFLLIAMAVIAVSGLKNIGRVSELFFILISIGIVGLLLLGVSTTDLSKILPLSDANITGVLEGFYKTSLWFGNFTLLYVFMGKIQSQENKKWGNIKLSFFIGSLFVAFAHCVFYGIYEYITPLKRNWLTKVSQFALLSLDIGRLDWFLILFGEIATILTAGIFVFASASCIKNVTGIKKINFIIYSLLLVLYLNTNVFVKSKLDIFRFLISFGAGFGIFVQYILPLFLLVVAKVYRKKHDSNYSLDKFKHNNKRKEHMQYEISK